jgi:hypothetical protein
MQSNLEISNQIFRENIQGSRNIGNFWWAFILLIGSTSFLFVGLSSFFSIENQVDLNNIPIIGPQRILFFPQGLVMCFYSLIGLLLSFYLWFILLWNIGDGFNEFNKEKGTFRVVRQGFPGKNRRIQIIYSIKDINCIYLEIKSGLNARRTIHIQLQNKTRIPLTQIGQCDSIF